MDNLTEQPILANSDVSQSQGALPVWIKVYTKPNQQTFVEITEHPEVKAKAAYIWVFVAGTLAGLINSLTQFIVTLAGLRQAVPQFGQLPAGSGSVFGVGGLLIAICSAPLAGVFSVIGFAIAVAIVHAAAKFFGGQGMFDKLAYAFGAIAVPYTLVSALMVPFNAIPFVAFGTLPILLLLGLYVLFLEITAVKAVHRFGWGEAAAAFFLPTILIGLLCGVLFVLLFRIMGPSINDVLRQFQQGMPHP